ITAPFLSMRLTSEQELRRAKAVEAAVLSRRTNVDLPPRQRPLHSIMKFVVRPGQVPDVRHAIRHHDVAAQPISVALADENPTIACPPASGGADFVIFRINQCSTV